MDRHPTETLFFIETKKERKKENRAFTSQISKSDEKLSIFEF